jgi:hypothetical protein
MCYCIGHRFHICIHRIAHVTMHATLAFVEYHLTEQVFYVMTGHESSHFVHGILNMAVSKIS